MVSITDPFKTIANWFSSSSKGKEIITILEHIAKGNFSYSVDVPEGKADDEHTQILKGLKLTLHELKKLDRREKRRSKQLIAANKQLRELDKNKREFMELASHQLKTPLASLGLGLDVLEQKSVAEWSEHDQKVFGDVRHSYEHLVQLVQSLLEAVRVNERSTMQPKYQLNNITHIIEVLEKQFRTSFEVKDIEFTVRQPETPLMVKTDAEFLVEILQNLLENALKYTHHGTVTLEVVTLKQAIEIRVTDTGIGIPQAEQDRVFDKLFRAGNVKDFSDVGSGLGLYYTLQLVKRLKGKLWFDSQEGAGSTFYVRLPRNEIQQK